MHRYRNVRQKANLEAGTRTIPDIRDLATVSGLGCRGLGLRGLGFRGLGLRGLGFRGLV